MVSRLHIPGQQGGGICRHESINKRISVLEFNLEEAAHIRAERVNQAVGILPSSRMGRGRGSSWGGWVWDGRRGRRGRLSEEMINGQCPVNIHYLPFEYNPTRRRRKRKDILRIVFCTLQQTGENDKEKQWRDPFFLKDKKKPKLRFMKIRERQLNMPPQNMSLWHIDYFKLQALAKQQMQGVAFSLLLFLPKDRLVASELIDTLMIPSECPR